MMSMLMLTTVGCLGENGNLLMQSVSFEGAKLNQFINQERTRESRGVEGHPRTKNTPKPPHPGQ
jgi:hypothetical protein